MKISGGLSAFFRFLCVSSVFAYAMSAEAGITYAVSPDDLQKKYADRTLQILIVPGHDDDTSGGTRFAELKEADFNLQLAKHLAAFFKNDRHFIVSLTRDDAGYLPEFTDYFANKRQEIISFRDSAKAKTQMLTAQGMFTPKTVIAHNHASEEDALKLYGINKWIIDHDIDIAIHIHFNDYPDRPWNTSSDYSGVSIYIPERQLPNHAMSLDLAQSIFTELTRYIHPSTNPAEKDGIIEDQELIAIGSYGSLTAPSLLIEYGYLPESPIAASARIRRPLLKELAYQTYRGIKLYFSPDADLFLARSSFLPRRWDTAPPFGAKESAEVLALQIALSHENLYPAAGFNPHDCLLTGNFGPCTKTAVKAFQKKYLLPQTGTVGRMTLATLNEIYDYRMPESAEDFRYAWKTDLSYGMKNSKDVAALQNALFLEGLYDDRITGNFSDTTRDGLQAFQERHGIAPIPPQGLAGPRTRKILNEIYSK
ncbi:MAG: peptidoglycan-binding protein [Candidatus Sungbacteria bacterium]|nr:peptidoglycan-binding protein [Candidatus Sungbacteria bacterium]